MANYRRYPSLQNSLSLTISQDPARSPSQARSNKIEPERAATRQRSSTISKFVQVTVGPAEELRGYFSTEADLRKIPYFDSLFDSMVLKLSSIKLPDEDPGAFGQLLYWVRADELQYDLPALCKRTTKSHANEKIFYPRSTEMVRTYVLAKKFGLEGLMNAVSDSLRKSLMHIRLTAGVMLLIVDNCDPNDPLYRLSMQALAVEINATGWSAWRTENNGWYQSFIAPCSSHSQLIVEALQTYKTAGPLPTRDHVCDWHSHLDSDRCVALEVPVESDIADVAPTHISIPNPSVAVHPSIKQPTDLDGELDITELTLDSDDSRDETATASETGLSDDTASSGTSSEKDELEVIPKIGQEVS